MEAGLDPVAGAPTGMSQQQQRDQLERGIDPATGRPIERDTLTPEQKLAREKFEYQKGQDALDWAQTGAENREKRVDEMNTEISALNSIIAQNENIQDVTQSAGRKTGAWTAGFLSPLKFVGGTSAASLAGDLETVKSDAFVANITEMRKNSPTGGAVGNVSDKDLEMLQSLQTSFRQNLPPKQLKSNLKKYQEIRQRVANDAKKGFVRKYGSENFNKYFGSGAQAVDDAGTSGGPVVSYDGSDYELVTPTEK